VAFLPRLLVRAGKLGRLFAGKASGTLLAVSGG
jgi:hypothetical protein